MAKQDLDRSKIASGPVYHRSLCSPQGMRSIVFATRPDRRHPLVDQPGVLPDAEMFSVAYTTGEGIVIDCSSSALKPGKQTSSDSGRDIELHGPSSLLLDHRRTSSNVVADDECPDLQLYQIAAAELAVDGKIEKRLKIFASRTDGAMYAASKSRFSPYRAASRSMSI